MSTYNRQIDVVYSNNAEYRNMLRLVFNMKMAAIDDPDIDDETKDEMTYDEFSSSAVLEYIFSKTREHVLFQKIYDIAAGFMFSVDRNIGMTVLFSYDYLVMFHPVLREYLANSALDPSSEPYARLLSKLQ